MSQCRSGRNRSILVSMGILLVIACVKPKGDSSGFGLLGLGFGGSSSGSTSPAVVIPAVSWVAPAPSLTGVPLNTGVSIGFTKDMDGTTLNASTFTLKLGATPISGTYKTVGTVVFFKPSGNLSPSTLYTVEVSTGARDTSGYAISAGYQGTFTTGTATDSAVPTILFTSPSSGATGVTANHSVTTLFNESMDGTTISSAMFTLKQGATQVPGTVGYAFNQLTFTPASQLLYGTTYTATILTGVKDLSGNALAADYSWSFTTGSAPDTTPPTVTDVTPLNGGTAVPVASAITATFSEALSATSITTATFTVSQSGTAVTGTVNYSGTTATFTPSSTLDYSKTYTVILQTAIKDLAGNFLASPYVWHFTTEAAPPLPRTVLSSLSYRDLNNNANSRYTSFAYSNGGYTVTLTHYTGTYTGSGGTVYGTTVVQFENPSGRLLSVAQDVANGSTQDTYASYSYDGTTGALTSVTYREGGNTSGSAIYRVAALTYDTSGQTSCWRSADASDVTSSIFKFGWSNGLPLSLSSFSSGTCTTPSSLTMSISYQFDGSSHQTCMESEVFSPSTSQSVLTYASYDSQGLAQQGKYYTSGTCAAPGTLDTTTNYSRTYSGALLTCEARNASGGISEGSVLSFALSSGLYTGISYYTNGGSGSCGSPGTQQSISTVTTTTVTTSNTAIDATGWMSPSNSAATQSVQMLRAIGTGGSGLLYPSGPMGDGVSSYAPRMLVFGPTNRSGLYPSDFTTYDGNADLTWTTCALGKTGADCTGGAAQTYQYCTADDSSCDDGSLLTSGPLFDACDALNNLHSGAGYGGKTGWRVPLGNGVEMNPVDRIAFPNSIPGTYWNATVYSGDPVGQGASSVLTASGIGAYYSIGQSAKTSALYVRCVAAGN